VTGQTAPPLGTVPIALCRHLPYLLSLTDIYFSRGFVMVKTKLLIFLTTAFPRHRKPQPHQRCLQPSHPTAGRLRPPDMTHRRRLLAPQTACSEHQDPLEKTPIPKSQRRQIPAISCESIQPSLQPTIAASGLEVTAGCFDKGPFQMPTCHFPTGEGLKVFPGKKSGSGQVTYLRKLIVRRFHRVAFYCLCLYINPERKTSAL